MCTACSCRWWPAACWYSLSPSLRPSPAPQPGSAENILEKEEKIFQDGPFSASEVAELTDPVEPKFWLARRFVLLCLTSDLSRRLSQLL